MARADLALRDDLARDGSLFQGYHPRMAALHQRHGTRLAALIDARRRAIGLGPLAQDLRRRRGALARGRGRGRGLERPPADWAARQREMDRWLRQVGWRE